MKIRKNKQGLPSFCVVDPIRNSNLGFSSASSWQLDFGTKSWVY